jgi:hypothetical protein
MTALTFFALASCHYSANFVTIRAIQTGVLNDTLAVRQSSATKLASLLNLRHLTENSKSFGYYWTALRTQVSRSYA